MSTTIASPDTFVELSTTTARAADELGITPSYLGVAGYDPYNGTGCMVSIGFRTQEDVDSFADYYGLPADDGETANYTRIAAVEIAEHMTTLVVYAGRQPAVTA